MALAKKFGAEGAEIVMLARNADKLAVYQKELAAEGIQASSFAADIADEQAYLAVLTKIAAKHPQLDVLHYNASVFNPALPSDLNYSTFLKEVKINIAGALLAVQAFLPAMKSAGKGAVYFTGGGSAFKAPPELVSLSIGKAGLRNFAQCLAGECTPLGIQVATVTIGGMVEPGTQYDPDRIAGEFWTLSQLPKAKWVWEVVI
jgi:NAD(P)-dependent dehydrogenase (short-subunit alcohol dehydrogenase family)